MAGPARSMVEAGELGRLLQVPASVLAFFEARLPEVRAVRDGGTRLYRAGDAVLLAGVATLLYRDGMTFREVQQRLATERDGIVALGRERLGARVSETPPAEPRRAMPEDVRVRGREGAAPPRAEREAAPGVEQVLSELMACLRALEAAR